MAVIGLDFGTCFSSAGYLSGDRIMALGAPSERNVQRIPSVFYHDKKNTWLGTKAVKEGRKKPEYMVEFIKKKMNEPFFQLDDKEYEPMEIVKEILTYVLAGADESLRREFHDEEEDLDVVITVPVAFSETRKKMIRDAAQSVILESERKVNIKAVIPEPVAAAMEYFGAVGLEEGGILVYDLGGGTFDTAIVQATGVPQSPYDVITQDGCGIGGNDWDNQMLELIKEKLLHELPEDMAEKSKRLFTQQPLATRLRTEAQQIKEELSSVETVESEILIQGTSFSITVSREEFEEATKYLLEETFRRASRLIRASKQCAVKEVILVGGSSYMPQVLTNAKKIFSGCHVRIVNPELAVAYGAARYAKLLEHVSEPVSLKATHTYGVGYLDEKGEKKIYNFIYKDDALPITKEKVAEKSNMGKFSHFAVFESDCEQGEQIVDLSRGTEIMHVTIRRIEDVPEGTESRQKLTLTRDHILEIAVTDSWSKETVTRTLKIDTYIV